MRIHNFFLGPRSLTRDFSFGFFLMVLFFSILVFSVSSFTLMKIQNIKFKQESAVIFKEFKKFIIPPLWHYDDEEINAICKTFLSGGTVAKIIIFSDNNKPLYTFGSLNKKKRFFESFSEDIFFRAKKIGKVDFYTKKEKYIENNRYYFVTTSIAIVLISVFISIATWKLLHIYVSRPLEKLLLWINQIKKGDYESVNIDFPQKEMQDVVHHFSLMVDKIKAREHELLASETRYRSIVEDQTEFIIRWLPDGTITFANKTYCDYFGVSEDECVGTNFFPLIHEEDRNTVIKKIESLMPSNPVATDEHRVILAGGKVAWNQMVDRAFFDSKGQVIEFQSVGRDVTERKQAEEALRESESKLRAIFDQTFQLMGLLSVEGTLLQVNRTALEFAGVDEAAVIGKPFWETAWWAHSPEEREKVRNAIQKAASGEFVRFETKHPSRSGTLRNLDFSIKPILDADGRVIYLNPEASDITERKQAENEMVQLRNQLKNIIDSMPSLIMTVNPEGKVSQWNTQAELKTGISAESALGRVLPDVFPQLTAGLERVRDTIANKKPRIDTKVPQTVDHQTRYQDITVYPLIANGVEGAVIRVDDVTERVRMEEMVIQSEKMLSVGGLAAGMAHEINNPLAGIMQNVDLVLRRLTEDIPANLKAAAECRTDMATIRAYIEKRDLPAYLGDVHKAGARASAIVKNMLSFARMGEGRARHHDVSELLDRTVEMAASDYDLKKKYDFRLIEIVREYDPGAPKVLCEGSKIQQVFMNILKNGAQAMHETAEGAGHRAKRPRFILRVSKADQGVCVEIEDNGPGMNKATRDKVFEPFFSTKAVGMGTGLGLSVSYFIIKENHGGSMTVESRPGEGTTFIINLPLKGRWA